MDNPIYKNEPRRDAPLPGETPRDVEERLDEEENRDAITGAPGSHPVGTGIGAASGGTAGAAIGSLAGPAGTAIGAVVGAVAGGLAGKEFAEAVNPTAEDAYWRENYRNRPYYEPTFGYEEYAPAYRYGWEARVRYAGRSFDAVEAELQRDWERAKAQSRLEWARARLASRDAWERIDRIASERSRRVRK